MSKKILFSILVILFIIFTLNINCYAMTLPSLDISSNNYSEHDKITLDEKKEIKVGESLQLYALITYGNDVMVDNDPNTLGLFVDENNLEGVTWTSNNPRIARIDNTGKVTGVSEGTATISAHYEKDDQDAEYEIKVIKSTEPRITKDQLSDALQKFVQEEGDESNNVKITVEDKTIKFSSDDYSSDFILNYDLTDTPTFTYTIDVQKGMSYNDFEEKSDMFTLPLLGYVAVANIQGAEFDDIQSYLFEYLIYSAFSNMSNTDTSNSYMILEDSEDGVTYIGDDKNVIKKSEFGERIIEYVDSMYSDNLTLDDSDALNSFKWIQEKQNVSDDSRKLVSTITINLDADFAKLAEYSNKYDPPSPSSSYKNGYSQEDPNKQPTVLPKAGLSYIALISLAGCVIIASAIRSRLKEYKDIK